LLCVQWKTPDDGQRNCPKHVEIYSKNKFEKLVYYKKLMNACLDKSAAHNFLELYRSSISALPGKWLKVSIFILHICTANTTLCHGQQFARSYGWGGLVLQYGVLRTRYCWGFLSLRERGRKKIQLEVRDLYCSPVIIMANNFETTASVV